jgi:hypothetical protein
VTRGRLAIAAALGLLSLLLLLATAPARLLPLFLDRQALALSGVSGSVWRGQAARAVLLTPAGPVHLGELHWRLEPLSLLTLAPRVRIETQWGRQRLVLRARQRGARVTVSDLDGSVDAALLRQLLPVGLRGRLGLQLSSLVLEPARLVSAEGNIVWQDAAWESVSGVGRLGSYAARVSSPAEGVVEARVETLAGPVTATGSLRVDGQRYAVDATVESRGAMDPELAQALSLVAVPRENGYLLRLDGPMPGKP